MAKKANGVASSNKDDSKLIAFLAAFLSIFGFIIAFIAKKDDKYVMFYAKQSLVVFIVCLVSWVAGWIPVIGKLIALIVGILALILWVLSWVYALSGQMKEVPIIGRYARMFNF